MSTLQAVVQLVDKMSGPLSRLKGLVNDFAKDTGKAAKSQEDLAKQTDKAAESQDGLAKSLKNVGAALASLAIAKQVFDAFVGATKAATEMDALANKTGIAASSLQAYKLAANTSSTDFDALTSGG